MSRERLNHIKPITVRKCIVCRKDTEGDLYCSRECVVKRQKDVFGASLKDLVNNPDLHVAAQFHR